MAQAASVPAVSDPPFVYDWRAVEKGVPTAALDDFATYSGIPLKDLLEVVIPPRTLKHRRQRQEALNVDESDRFARVARVYELAVKVYGNRDDGRQWMLNPKDRFEDRSPLSILRSEAGQLAVEEYLYQI